MAKVRDVLQSLEQIAPARYAFEYDKVGLQVGDESQAVSKALVSLDRSIAAVERCIEIGAEMLVAHHPLLFRPVDSITTRTHVGRSVLLLASHGISFAAAHTNWDAAQGGVNDRLAELFALHEVRSFGSAAGVERAKLVFFCPESSVDEVIDACSEAGAGEIGLYGRCAFMHSGTGTFLGGEGSRPVVGTAGNVETVEEMRVEMVLPLSRERAVTRALQRAHPYEEPAYDLFRLIEAREQPGGRLGELASPATLEDFASTVGKVLETKTLTWGDPSTKVRSVAVVGGSADDEWRAAQNAGADVLVTGEVKQHNALEAAESGFSLIAAGHYATEQPGAEALMRRLQAEVGDVEWELFTPVAGFAGRPF